MELKRTAPKLVDNPMPVGRKIFPSHFVVNFTANPAQSPGFLDGNPGLLQCGVHEFQKLVSQTKLRPGVLE